MESALFNWQKSHSLKSLEKAKQVHFQDRSGTNTVTVKVRAAPVGTALYPEG